MSSIIKNRYLNYEPEDVVKVTVDRNIISSGANALDPDAGEDDFATKLGNLSRQIEEANEELDKLAMQKQEMIDEANSQAEAIRNEALKEGSELGYAEGKHKVDAEFAQMKHDLLVEMGNERTKLEEEKKQFFKDFKEKVGTIIPNALAKLYEHEVKTEPHIIDAIILKGLMELSDEKDIRVILSEDDYKTFDREAFLQNLKNGGYDKDVAITYDKDLTLGDCLIDTNAGFISCGMNDFAKSLSLLIESNITM